MYNKYGLAGMKFIVLENCLKEELSIKEAHWILQIDQDLRLNLAGVGEFPEVDEAKIARTSPNLGRKRSEETKKRISEALKGKAKSKEHRENLSKAVIVSAARPEVKKNMSEAQKGKKQSKETIKRKVESMKRFYARKKENIIEEGEKNEPKIS